MREYKAGIDIGSTTVKLVVLDETDRMIYGQYRRHMARTQATLAELLAEAQNQILLKEVNGIKIAFLALTIKL